MKVLNGNRYAYDLLLSDVHEVRGERKETGDFMYYYCIFGF